jgi:hypothetical protein
LLATMRGNAWLMHDFLLFTFASPLWQPSGSPNEPKQGNNA